MRAAIRVLELAATAANTGGRPLFDAEELRFEQRLDDSGAVDGDERPTAATAKLVELSGNEFLASAALAFNQHGEVGRCNALDLRAQRLHDVGRSDQRTSTERRARRGRSSATDLEHEPADMRERDQHVVVGFCQRPVWLTRRLKDSLDTGIGRRHTEDDRIGGPRWRDQPRLISSSHLSQSHGSQLQCLSHVLLEGGSEIIVGSVGKCSPERLEYLPQARDVPLRSHTGLVIPSRHGIGLTHKALRRGDTKGDATFDSSH